VAYLTRDQEWLDLPPPGIAVFTGLIETPEALRAALAGYGLTKIEQL